MRLIILLPFLVIHCISYLAGSGCAANTDFPKTVQLDLVFPQPGKTYFDPPSSLFPIIFAVRNTTAAWPYFFRFKWILVRIDDVLPEGNTGEVDFFGRDDDHSLRTGPPSQRSPKPVPSPPDDFLIVNSTSVRLRPGQYQLGVETGFLWNCTAQANETDPDVIQGWNAWSALYGTVVRFAISETGEVPDVAAVVGACSKPLVAVELVGERTYVVEDGIPTDHLGQVCPIVSKTKAKLPDCGYKLTEADVEKVEDKVSCLRGQNCLSEGYKAQTRFLALFVPALVVVALAV